MGLIYGLFLPMVALSMARIIILFKNPIAQSNIRSAAKLNS